MTKLGMVMPIMAAAMTAVIAVALVLIEGREACRGWQPTIRRKQQGGPAQLDRDRQALQQQLVDREVAVDIGGAEIAPQQVPFR